MMQNTWDELIWNDAHELNYSNAPNVDFWSNDHDEYKMMYDNEEWLHEWSHDIGISHPNVIWNSNSHSQMIWKRWWQNWSIIPAPI